MRNSVKALKDIGFYLDCLEKTGGPVLELGCGTGRVMIPLAKADYHVWGIDLSEQMLTVLAKKRKKLAANIKRRLHIVQADMRSFDLRRKFSLIIIPAGSFHLVTSKQQQSACLGCVRRHLSENGRFIFNLRDFTKLNASWLQKEELPVGELDDPEGRYKIRQAALHKTIDFKKQIFSYDQVFYFKKPNGPEKRVAGPMRLAWFSEKQIRKLLSTSGLEIVEAMGNYDGSPIGQGPYFLFVCRLKKRKSR